MQGDKIFDLPDYNVFGRLASISIVSFLFVVQFDVLCLQLIYNYFSLTGLIIQISGKDSSVTVSEKYRSTGNRGMLGLLRVKYKITLPFLFIALDC